MKKKKQNIKRFTASNRLEVQYEDRVSKPLTDAEWKQMKRVDVDTVLSKKEQQALSEFTVRGRGRPRKEKPKVNATLRLDQEILDAYRATGPGWQTRINKVLHDSLIRPVPL